jgi:hypothetical protein
MGLTRVGRSFSNGFNGGFITNAGTFRKSGGTGISTIAVPFTNTGTISINSGKLTLSGQSTLNLPSTSILDFKLSGETPAVDYGKLNIPGTLAAAGTLHVSLNPGFTPFSGDSFDILDWTSLSGTFSTLDLPTLGGRIVWDSSHLYDSGAQGGTLSVIATYYAGDFNRDGHVNAADILLAMAALTNTADYRTAHGLTDPTLFGLVADVNGDGSFTNADLQYLLNTLKSGGGSSDPVPEPASIVLVGLGALVIAFRRRVRWTTSST